MQGLMADSAGSAWTFGASILSFVFPMTLFIVVAGTLYVLYTKPEFVPGHPAPGLERPVSYTPVPGKPTVDRAAPAPSAAEMAQASAAPTVQATSAEPPEATAGEAAETEDTE
jgi:hypothetical protein